MPTLLLLPATYAAFALAICRWPGPVGAAYARRHAARYLAPGAQLRLTPDVPSFDETRHYVGRGAGPENYLADARRHFAYSTSTSPAPTACPCASPESRKRPSTTK